MTHPTRTCSPLRWILWLCSEAVAIPFDVRAREPEMRAYSRLGYLEQSIFVKQTDLQASRWIARPSILRSLK